MGNCQGGPSPEAPQKKLTPGEQEAADLRKSEVAKATAKEELLAAKEKAREEKNARDIIKQKDLLAKADKEAQEAKEAKAKLDLASAALGGKQASLEKEAAEAALAAKKAAAGKAAAAKEKAEMDAAAALLIQETEQAAKAALAAEKEAADVAVAKAALAAAAEKLAEAQAEHDRDESIAKKSILAFAEKAHAEAEKAHAKEVAEAKAAKKVANVAEMDRAEAEADHKKEADEAEAATKKAEELAKIAAKEKADVAEASKEVNDAQKDKNTAERAHKLEEKEALAAATSAKDHEQAMKDDAEEDDDDAFGVLPDKAHLAEQKAKLAALELEKQKLANTPPVAGYWKITKKARNGSIWTMKQERWLVVSRGTLFYYDMKDAAENSPPWYKKGNACPKSDMKNGVVGCVAEKWHDKNEDGSCPVKSPNGPKRRASTIGGDDALTIEVISLHDKALICQFVNQIEVDRFLKIFAAQVAFYSANQELIGKA